MDNLYIIRKFEQHDYVLSPDKADKLNRFYELLIEWNERVNLTAITEYEEVVLKHFIDSALLLFMSDTETEYLTDDEQTLYDSIVDSRGVFDSTQPFPLCRLQAYIESDDVKILDVGSGAGFPGIVLGILIPGWDITLLDSLNKRVEFLDTVISELSLTNIHTIHGRAEELARDESHRLSYDIVLSRAVAELPVLLELCTPFVSDDGLFISYKGPKYEEEMKSSEHAFSQLHVRPQFVLGYDVRESKRYLVGFDHEDAFPDKYPRRAGMPAKRPL